MISYKPLKITLAEKEISRKELAKACHISTMTMARIDKGEQIGLNILDKVCQYLQVPLDKVVEIRLENSRDE